MTGATRSEPGAPPRPHVLRAWRATRYEAAGIAIRIGRRSPAADALLRRLGGPRGVLITAWNPRSRRLPDGLNHRRQRRLAEALRRRPTVPARGGLDRWHEDMVLAVADPRVLARVGRRFRQSAIVVLRVNRPARLMLL